MSEKDATATVDDTQDIDQTDETDIDETENESDLRDAGKKAIDAMKAERNTARDEARKVKAELDRIKRELANKDKPAEEQALEAARAEARTEATQKANERILRADLRAAATGKLADPSDAALYLDLSEFTVSDDGETDSDALSAAIADLLERKPHLAAGKPNRFDGGADQGAKGKASKLSQLTQADMESMSPAEINEARRQGRFNKILGIS